MESHWQMQIVTVFCDIGYYSVCLVLVYFLIGADDNFFASLALSKPNQTKNGTGTYAQILSNWEIVCFRQLTWCTFSIWHRTILNQQFLSSYISPYERQNIWDELGLNPALLALPISPLAEYSTMTPRAQPSTIKHWRARYWNTF